VRAAARAWMVPGVSPLDITAEFDRSSGDAKVWLALRRADLSAWSELRAGGVGPLAGAGRVEAWVDLRGYRVASVTMRGEIQDLRMHGPARDAAPPREVDLGELGLDARWAAVDGGWRLDAPRLRLGAGQDAQVLDGLLRAGGARRALVAERIDAGALVALAPLVPAMPEALARWLAAARPDGVLHGVEVVGEAGGALRADARID